MSYFTELELEEKGHSLINPFDFEYNCYQLTYSWGIISKEYLVIAEDEEEAVEKFADFCVEKKYDWFIEEDFWVATENEGEYLPINGGEFYLEAPLYIGRTATPTFAYSITYEAITPESAEYGDFEETGFVEKDEVGTLEEIACKCEDFGITSCEGAGWLYSIDPGHDEDFFIRGAEKFYALHIEEQGHNDRKLLETIEDYLKNN